HPPGGDALPVLFQYLQDRCGQENAPAGGPGLGLGDHQFSPDTLDLPLYSQHPSPEIQIVPLEGQDLAPRRPVDSSSRRSSKQPSSLAWISRRWISSPVSTCISLGRVTGALQERAGFFKLNPWATA